MAFSLFGICYEDNANWKYHYGCSNEWRMHTFLDCRFDLQYRGGSGLDGSQPESSQRSGCVLRTQKEHSQNPGCFNNWLYFELAIFLSGGVLSRCLAVFFLSLDYCIRYPCTSGQDDNT